MKVYEGNYLPDYTLPTCNFHNINKGTQSVFELTRSLICRSMSRAFHSKSKDTEA